jgi:hypothetical protein
MLIIGVVAALLLVGCLMVGETARASEASVSPAPPRSQMAALRAAELALALVSAAVLLPRLWGLAT